MQTQNGRGGVRWALTRWVAAVALVIAYSFATAGIVAMGTTSAMARGRGGGGRGRGGFRGRGRGRGGFGIYLGGYDGCYWSRRWRRWVCPYY